MRKITILGCILGILLLSIGLQAQDSTYQEAKKEITCNLKIKLASIFVDDQDKALKFYTEVLGFTVKNDVPIGEYKWLTVVSPENPDGTELLLEPNVNSDANKFQKAIYEQGIPAAALFVDDLQEEYERLEKLGVKFTMMPAKASTTMLAISDDTCGNLIQIAQE